MLSMLSICRANSRVALRHLSVGAHLVGRRLSQCLGWQELASLKHHATCFQSLLGCSLCLPTLPSRRWRGITFCTAFSNSLRYARPSLSKEGQFSPRHCRDTACRVRPITTELRNKKLPLFPLTPTPCGYFLFKKRQNKMSRIYSSSALSSSTTRLSMMKFWRSIVFLPM